MAAISKAEYLKRYLSKDEAKKEEKKKKRRKIKPSKDSKFKIIDDDIDFKAQKRSCVEDELDDEAPTVADIIDERPQHVQQLEIYRKNSRWKVLGAEEEDDLTIQEYGVIDHHSEKQIISDTGKAKQQRKRHDSSGSDSEAPRSTWDSINHPAKAQRQDSNVDNLTSQRKPSGDSRKFRHDSDSDSSSPGSSQVKHHHQKTNTFKAVRKNDLNDQSLERQCKEDLDSPRRKLKSGSDSDQSPQRKGRGDSDSDQSLPRKNKRGSDSDQSPPRKRKGGSDSDQSPPRRRKGGSDSDQSPQRKKKGGSDSDQSPSRKKSQLDVNHMVIKRSRASRFHSDGDSEKMKKATKTLSGAKAGLSSAKEMREETRKLREKEEISFQSIDEQTSGRHAKTVVRDKETGKRRDMKAEEAKNEEEERRKDEQLKKYQQWGKGLKQVALREAKLEDQIQEASKPLARYRDDKDLDDMLRKEERAEDPMLAFIKTKKQKEEEKSGKVKKKELPKYKGPPPPPNRYNIMPGYRWDGVDRSNGFEKKIFAMQANKKAVQEIAYKWSTEDM